MVDSIFLVVLFKNKVRKKIIKTFKTSKRCTDFYNKLVKESNNVVFDRKHDNGYDSKYEIAMVKSGVSENNIIYKSDEYGRNIKIEVEDDNFTILDIKNYKVSEKIFDLQSKKRIDLETFINLYLSKKGIKMISKLNNRVVVQKDEKVWLFSLKNIEDAYRFMESLSSHFFSIGRGDCIFVKDTSTIHRKYLYELLEEKGYTKDFLYRQVTTFGVKK